MLQLKTHKGSLLYHANHGCLGMLCTLDKLSLTNQILSKNKLHALTESPTCNCS